MEHAFAAIGATVSAIIVIAVALGVLVAAIDAVRQWLKARDEMVVHLGHIEEAKVALIEANTALIEASKNMNERLRKLEGDVYGD